MPKAEAKVEVPEKAKIQASKVKIGHLMCLQYWVRVTGTDRMGEHLDVSGVTPGTPSNFRVDGKELVESSLSADQYATEEKVSQTQAAELLVNAYNQPFTVFFQKQDGEYRTLRGRLVRPEPLLGRSHVEDLDIPADKSPRRLVDHREIIWLVLGNVKYAVKGK